MTIKAKFRSICPNCQVWIEADETVIWEKGSKARHVQCSGSAIRAAAELEARHPAPKRIAVEDQGVYLLIEGDDEMIVKVKANREKTRTYGLRWVDITGERLLESGEHAHGKWVYERGLVGQIAESGRKMTLDEAKAFIIRYGQCVRCGRHLSAAKSVEQGIGPVCIKYFSPPPTQTILRDGEGERRSARETEGVVD